MSDYISREALRDVLYEEDAITMKGVAILNTFPAADVRPVVLCSVGSVHFKDRAADILVADHFLKEMAFSFHGFSFSPDGLSRNAY